MNSFEPQPPRKTGRTTRMFEFAASAVREGECVAIVCKDYPQKDWMSRKFREMFPKEWETKRVEVVTVDHPWLDRELWRMRGQSAQVFVDHSVLSSE